MEIDPTVMYELLVGLGNVDVVGVDDVADEPIRVHVETRQPRPDCGRCGDPGGGQGAVLWPSWWICVCSAGLHVWCGASTGGRDEPQRGEQPVARCGTQEPLQLLSGPGLLLHFGNRPELRGVSHERDVACHDASTGGIIGGATDDEMDLQHGLGCQGFPPVGWMEFLVVERFEMVWAQTPNRDLAEGREDVPVDLAAVAVPGAASQLEFLAWQLPGGQIGPEGE